MSINIERLKKEKVFSAVADLVEIYYRLNFYHFAVERQSGTGNCFPLTRNHYYQKRKTFQLHFWCSQIIFTHLVFLRTPLFEVLSTCWSISIYSLLGTHLMQKSLTIFNSKHTMFKFLVPNTKFHGRILLSHKNTMSCKQMLLLTNIFRFS